jgi:hypothetical protein
MISTSSMTGTFVSRCRPSARSVAAISLSTEFFAPGTVTSPLSGPLVEVTMTSSPAGEPFDMPLSMLPP